ncbi:hypothetical protein [Eubacterium ramulus]
MAMDEMLVLPGVNVADLCIISELQKSIKANKVISYLSKKTEAREEAKGTDYGGTNGKMLSFREEKMLNVTGRMDWER